MIGEGGSGGAVALAVSDRVLMQENAIYSVISPEGCAAILWRDAGEAKKAAAAFKPDARHCLELGVIDGIVPEPEGGAQNDHDEAARLLAERARGALDELDGAPGGRAPPPPAGQVPRAWAFSPELRIQRLSTASTGFSTGTVNVRAGTRGLGENPPFGEKSRARSARERRVELASTGRKREPGKTPEPFGGDRRRRRADLRRPAPRRAPASTTTSGSSATARSPRGRCRRAFRSSRARRRSPSTSRITRSTTRASPARSRRASTARERSRSGTAGTYELRRGEARRRAHGPAPRRAAATGSGRSCRRTSTARRRTGC